MRVLFIPWDFVLILLLLGTVVPWRGAVKMNKLLRKPEMTGRDRLVLYGTTILFQWLLVGIVALSCLARSVDPEELAFSGGDPRRAVLAGLAVTGILCALQFLAVRKLLGPGEERVEKRGRFFAISERIMPRTVRELLVFAALACTAGISEEFLYRGFVFAAFVRMVVNYGSPTAPAAILSSLWFGLAHLYQGRRGLITTFVVGLILVSVRIWTGSLLPVIVAHAGIDLTVGFCFFRFAPKAQPLGATRK